MRSKRWLGRGSLADSLRFSVLQEGREVQKIANSNAKIARERVRRENGLRQQRVAFRRKGYVLALSLVTCFPSLPLTLLCPDSKRNS